MAKHDKKFWDSLENEYIITSISYRDIIDKYKVPKRTLEEYAKKENWTEKRGQFRGNSAAETEKLQQTQSEKDAKESMQVRYGERSDFSLLRK